MSDHQHCTTTTTGQPLRLSEADFHERLVRFFGPFSSVSPMDWTCLRESATHFAPFFKFPELVSLFFDYVFGLFEDCRIADGAVIDTWLKEYARFKMDSCGLRSDEPGAHRYPQDQREPEGSPFYYEYSVMEPDCTESVLTRPFLYEDKTAIARILRYSAPAYIETEDLDEYIKHVLDSILEDPFVQYNVDIVEGSYVRCVEGHRRMKLTMMVIDFLLQERSDYYYYEGAIQGLRLLFQALPDVYITWQEISEFLTRRIKLEPSEVQPTYMECLRASLEDVFPECARLPEPRSLMHLARCEVRRCLSAARTLPHGVRALGLPGVLEDYVTLQFRTGIPALSDEKVFVVPGPVPEIQSQQETPGLSPVP